MTRSEFEASVDQYLAEIRAKLLKGWEIYGGGNAVVMSTDEIKQEIREESVDVLGWAFFIWLSQRS